MVGYIQIGLGHKLNDIQLNIIKQLQSSLSDRNFGNVLCLQVPNDADADYLISANELIIINNLEGKFKIKSITALTHEIRFDSNPKDGLS